MVITLAPAIAEVAQVDASSGVLSWVENVNGRSSMRPPVNVNSALGIEPAISPKILGVELQGARRRSNTAAEDKRLQTSLQLIRKSTYLPVEWNVKTKVITGAIMGKVTWGWMFRRPPAHMNRARGELTTACPHLRTILRGHSLSIRFRILQINFRAASRLARRGNQPCLWSNKGWPVWLVLGPADLGTWGAGPNHFAKCARDQAADRVQLRESFRRFHFTKFLNSRRREAEFCAEQGITYERVCAKARKLCTDMPVCPFCDSGAVPTVLHVAWDLLMDLLNWLVLVRGSCTTTMAAKVLWKG